jgi:putative tryptophan/tyrosine transport system substrate-binding protein
MKNEYNGIWTSIINCPTLLFSSLQIRRNVESKTMKLSRIILIAVIALMIAISSVAYAQEPIYTIGSLNLFTTPAFTDQLAELGYVEGQNMTYLSVKFVEGWETMAPEELMAESQRQAQTVIDAQPDVLLVNTDSDAALYRPLAGNIPIVFARSDDPVATGAVLDLVNPGGFTTGVITNRPHERRLQILTEILPTTDKVYYLYNPLTGDGETVLQQVKAVGEELGVEVIPAPVTDGASGVEALNNMPEDVDWLFLTPFVPFDFVFFQALDAVSVERAIGIAGVIDAPTKGQLMGYGPNIEATDVQAAHIIDRILRGAIPADLPVETAENYLTINLEQAGIINLDIPESILRQANLIVRPGYFDNLPAFGFPTG